MIKRILSLFFALIILLILPQQVDALTPEQRKVIRSGSYHFNVEQTNNQCANDSVNLTGSDNIERIYNYFLSKGLTPAQSAGVAGNAMAESGGDPTALSRSGYQGIFQWDANNRWPRVVAFAEERGMDPNTLEAQLEFAFDEATQRGNIEGIKEYDAVDLATWYWGRFYEVAIIGGSTSTTPLTNVQHLERRIEYANEISGTYGNGSATGGTSTGSCVGGNGQATQYVDGFTVYSQYDPDWVDRPYSTSTIGISGCGPAAMAMIITALSDQPVTPVQTADYAGSIGMYIEGVGSSWTIGPRLAEHWGLRSEPVERNVAAITEVLREGKLVIAPGQGPKPFTSGGHFIVIRGVTADGKFKIADSAHNDTSTQDWDPDFIVSNMRDGGTYAIFK